MISCNRTNVKNPKGSFFQIFRHYETAIKISYFFLSKIFKDSKEYPFNFLKFCNRIDVKKSQRVPSFTVSGIVTFLKKNNFRVKIWFSQVRHAISDFCCFKRPVLFLFDFLKKLFHRFFPQFLPETKRFARVKNSSRFSALCDLPETIKKIFENLFPQLSVF